MATRKPTPSWFMGLALRLAARGRDAVSPNPMVGAVVVRRGRVVGKGFHRRCGGPHAEVHALRDAGPKARGADLYVTLEPCAHRGRTPPCMEAILDSGLARVFYAIDDPNPATRGKGPALLRAAGLTVTGGLLADEARHLNRPYLYWRATLRPWVILKWAMTLDGKIATRTGESRWITGEAARAHAHRLRRRVDGVLVGTGTAIKDDPLLLPRPSRGRVPARIILDRRGRLPLSLRFFQSPGEPLSAASPKASANQGRRICVVGPRVGPARRRELTRRGIEILQVPERGGRLSIPALLAALGAAGIAQLLVEGGGEVIGAFLDEGLAQEVAVFIAPTILGGAGAPGPALGLGTASLADGLRIEAPAVRRIGRDLLIEGRLIRQRQRPRPGRNS